MLKRSSSTTTKLELKNIRSNSLRKINFSVPSISNRHIEQEIINQKNSLTSLDSTCRYARTTFILEVGENHKSYSECDTSENYSSTNVEEATSGFCSAETPESATRIFAELSLKKVPTKSQSDSRIGKRKSCCCCKLPLCPIDNYGDEDKENDFCKTCVQDRTMTQSTESSSTFRVNSNQDMDSKRSTELKINRYAEYIKSKHCLGLSHRTPCQESDSKDEALRTLTLVKIATLEKLCEYLLEQMCTSTGCFEPLDKIAPKKAKSAMNLSCKGKVLKYPKPKPKFCFIHKSSFRPPYRGTLVPNLCLKRRVIDPVDLYHYYRCQWKRFNVPPVNDFHTRNAQIWLLREKFLNPKFLNSLL